MASRRMIARDVICTDAFISMTHGAQALFFQLQIEGDEFGMVGSPLRTLRALGCEDAHLAELEKAGFIIRFPSGVIAMRHWDMANTRKNDRTNKTSFRSEFEQLAKDENGVYYLEKYNGIQMESQHSLAEPSVAQPSVAQKSRISDKSSELCVPYNSEANAFNEHRPASEEFYEWYVDVGYPHYKGQPHPRLKKEQRERALANIDAFLVQNGSINDETEDMDTLIAMANYYFENKADCDHNINHFSSPGILEIAFLNGAY